jgi:hypothetical protein
LVPNPTLAGNFPILNEADQGEGGFDPTAILLAVTRADLLRLKRVHVMQAHSLTSDHERIAVDYLGEARPGLRSGRKGDQGEKE